MVVRMNEREILIYLQTIKGVGWRSLERLVTAFDSLQSILEFQPIELSMFSGIDLSVAETIYRHLSNTPITFFLEQLNQWKEKGIRILTIKDDEYPRFLKEIAQSPWVLYTKGNIELLKKPAISIVGTRNPTAYGITVTEKLSKDLSHHGWTIVSGMARGIDRIAHETALSNQGKTIAVLGSGIDVIYPKENQRLYNRLTQEGLVLSEYPPGTNPIPGYFPQRNRVISGLSQGTLVVEASLKSGSLITAQHALDQSREVFAIPGQISSKQSLGTNLLIQQGAKLVQKVADINDEFPYLILKNERPQDDKNVKLSKNEQQLYSLISEKIHIDDILADLNLVTSEIYESLLSLQLKGLIQQMPGGYYRRKEA